MKVKANINGKTYERTVRTFTTDSGRSFRYIVINRTPYIVQTLNWKPIGLMSIEKLMEEVPA